MKQIALLFVCAAMLAAGGCSGSPETNPPAPQLQRPVPPEVAGPPESGIRKSNVRRP